MKRYSLANYILSIESNDPTIKNIFGTVSVGGEGNYLESMTISQTNDLWTTSGYATGAWVHTKNLSRIGTVEVSLSQLSNQISKFIKLCNTYYTGDYDGCTLTLTDNLGNLIATCVDCYIQKIPDQGFQSAAQNQSWTFTCGQITFNA